MREPLVAWSIALLTLATLVTGVSAAANYCGGGAAGSGQGGLTCNFYASPSGSDSNAGTSASPFLTPAKLQTALRAAGSGNQVGCLKSGTYTLTSGLTFGSTDNNETWQYDPASGVNTAKIAGGGNVPVSFNGVTNWTWNGIAISGCAATCVNTPNVALDTNLVVENSDISGTSSNTGGALGSGIIDIDDCSNCTFANNYLHNGQGPGIALGAYNTGDTIAGAVVSQNVVIGVCNTLDDCGGIYVIMNGNFPTNSGATSNPLTIKNNFVQDIGFAETSGNGFRDVYLDNDSSLVTVTGNILAPQVPGARIAQSSTMFMNGGDGNIWTGNVIDNGTSNTTPALGAGFCGQGGGQTCTTPTASPNSISKNIVLMNFSGANAYAIFSFGNHQWGTGYASAPGGPSAWITISSNDYHNKAGGSEDTTGSDVNDASPNHSNPGCSGALYTFSALPSGFVDPILARVAGPPGFVIPAPIAVHSC